MALAIKIVPTIEGDDAKRFDDEATIVESNPYTLDYTQQIEIVQQYLNSINL